MLFSRHEVAIVHMNSQHILLTIGDLSVKIPACVSA